LGESYEPLRCILRSQLDRKLLASCGTKIIVIETREGVAVEKIINTVDNWYVDVWSVYVCCEDAGFESVKAENVCILFLINSEQ
jgi:hypothetical protein